MYRQTLEILHVLFQTTAVKLVLQYSQSQEFFGLPVYIKVVLILQSVMCALYLKKVHASFKKYFIAQKC